MERASGDAAVDFLFGHAGNLLRRARPSEQGAGGWQACFIACPNGKDAGDKNFKNRSVTFSCQFKERSFREICHGFPKQKNCSLDIKRLFSFEHRRLNLSSFRGLSHGCSDSFLAKRARPVEERVPSLARPAPTDNI